MKFYRFEFGPLNGVYAGNNQTVGHSVLRDWSRKFYSSKHRPPCDDYWLTKKVGYNFSEKYFFGFNSHEQAKTWFFDDEIILELAAHHGLEVCCYEVSEIISGDYQSIAPITDYKLDNCISRASAFDWLSGDFKMI